MPLALALLLGCVRPAAPPGPEATLPGVALIEWQFPRSPGLRVAPLHERLLADDPSLLPALYPGFSELSLTESARGLEILELHASRVATAYAAGRDHYALPIAVNVSEHSARALTAAIAAGVRIVATSTGSDRHLGWLDAIVTAHPDVLFVVATPHISGNTISVEELGERPGVLAPDHGNVVLAGCIEWYGAQAEAAAAGQALGSPDNPFSVDNQPVSAEARQVFMLSCDSTRAFVDGFGGTSAAAPHLASLYQLALERALAAGRTPSAADLFASVDGVLHRTHAQEKTGEIHEVSAFTLDTVLLAAGRPLATEWVWGDLADPPRAKAFDP